MARKKKRNNRPKGFGTLIAPAFPDGPWAIQYMEGSRRRYKGGLKDKSTAEAVLKAIAGEAVQGRSLIPASSKDADTLEVEAEAFLKIRDVTNAAHAEDRGRWRNHLSPYFGHLKPQDVNTRTLRTFIEVKLAEGMNPATIRIMVSLLRGLFRRVVDDGKLPANPLLGLSKEITKLYKPTYDCKTTPFIEKLADVQRIYLDLPEPLNIAYAVGALAGLRTGEVFALKWSHVDLEARRIHVRESVKGPLKDKESRIVPILDALEPILKAWKLKSGGEGLIVPAMRIDGEKIAKSTPGKYLRETLEKLKLTREGLGWYECTRHTFASHWVLNGGSIEKLKEMLGHYSVVVTEKHYVHLKPELFTAKDLGTIPFKVPAQAGQLGRIKVKAKTG